MYGVMLLDLEGRNINKHIIIFVEKVAKIQKNNLIIRNGYIFLLARDFLVPSGAGGGPDGALIFNDSVSSLILCRNAINLSLRKIVQYVLGHELASHSFKATMESVEALCSIAHVASEGEVRASLQRLLTGTKARRRALGILACCHRAIKLNPDVGVCRALLSQPELRQCINNVEGKKRFSLLHAAVLRPTPDGAEIVKLLLAIPEIDLNVVSTPDGLTPLHLACLLSRSAIVPLLVQDRRVDLTATTLDCRTALHCARDREVVRMLVKANTGSVLHARDSHGKTALHYAAENHHTALVPELLECSLDQDDHGRLPVHLAAQNGHGEEVRLLLRHAPRTLRSQDEDSLTPLHHAARGGHLHILQDWVPQIVDIVTVLKVTKHSRVGIFLLQELDRQLLASSPSRLHASSLLQFAVESHCVVLIPYILKWHPHLANEVIDEDRNQTALHVATISGELEVVQALSTEQGWSLNANKKDNFNKTALDYANDLGHREICEYLMRREDVKDYVAKLQKEQDTYVSAANAILVVAVLMASGTYASCTQPLVDENVPVPLQRFSIYGVIEPTTFLTSIVATLLGACAALPFSLGLYVGKHTGWRQSDYIGHRVRRIRVLVALASYFVLLSLACMVFSFSCSVFNLQMYKPTSSRIRRLACTVFTLVFVSFTVLAFVTYFSRAIYYRAKQLSFKTRKSFKFAVFVKI